MKRFCLLVALTLFTPFAHAGEGISFSIGGHRVHVDSTRCRSLSCVSVSGASRRDDGGDNGRMLKPVPAPAATAAIPATPAASALPAPVQAASPAPPPIIVYKPAPVAPAAAPPPSAPSPPRVMTPPPPPVVAAPPPPPAAAPARPAPPVIRVSREADEPDDGPIGDWQTEANNLVRIRLCGTALCGYALDRTTRDLGEAMLINMKPKNSARWNGGVYSQDSGNIRYGTIELKAADRLRVSSCALGRVYCTGADWVRVSHARQRVITQGQLRGEPRS
ncbi:DUF2147 domain-containing protein [Bradyrhizobium erythrophlei]|uniref:DUF2147 domain-containing protein n=1 Tax=Bradyrhizobium erythrophlei TaxID=1437360 RepID=A0A1H4VBB5_9BRAD|nr:DUF2147 domain-containing protein [Bradyrhizobium erythrophlei]SEC78277.1 hypothetical protein SAMN05444164_2738 [Bradyrhizobium erythrophlei]